MDSELDNILFVQSIRDVDFERVIAGSEVHGLGGWLRQCESRSRTHKGHSLGPPIVISIYFHLIAQWDVQRTNLSSWRGSFWLKHCTGTGLLVTALRVQMFSDLNVLHSTMSKTATKCCQMLRVDGAVRSGCWAVGDAASDHYHVQIIAL